MPGKLVIFDNENHGSSHSWKVRGFENLQEAEEYKRYILDQYGYGPSASIVTEPEITVKCSIYNSCD